MQFHPYLGFNGQCREAFETYARVLGGQIAALHTFGETPEAGQMPPGTENLVMHARLEASGAILMGSDAPPGMFQPAQGLYVSLHVEEPSEAERIYHALSEGGEIQMPIQETFWAKRFGMFTDRFGTPWMINCEGQS